MHRKDGLVYGTTIVFDDLYPISSACICIIVIVFI